VEVLVYNCFHWIGFHYVNVLLEKGMVVKGMDHIDSDKKENLSMFFGRNSSFQLVSSRDSLNVDVAIIIGNREIPSKIKAERIIKITNHVQQEDESTNVITIIAPILYGEWMDMTAESVILGQRRIAFDSEEFQSTAIHVLDFIQATLPLFQKQYSPSIINVFSKKVFLDDAVKLENSLYIRDNRPIEKNVKKVIEHYKRHKELY
jgi:hypothetical protein